MALAEQAMLDMFLNSDFGFLGNLLPIVLIIGISWGLSRKPRDIMFIQLPLTLVFKVFFPFLHPSLVVLSFAIFIMNIIGSKGDLLADVKEIPEKTIGSISRGIDNIRQGITGKLSLKQAKREFKLREKIGELSKYK